MTDVNSAIQFSAAKFEMLPGDVKKTLTGTLLKSYFGTILKYSNYIYILFLLHFTLFSISNLQLIWFHL